jgi:hypothetical protein
MSSDLVVFFQVIVAARGVSIPFVALKPLPLPEGEREKRGERIKNHPLFLYHAGN